MKKLFVSFLVVVLCASLLVACGSNASDSTPGAKTSIDAKAPSDSGKSGSSAAKNVFRFARPEAFMTWDTFNQNALTNMMLNPLVFDTLVYKTEDGSFEPLIAKEWSISTDGLVYTFKLNEGIKFHNGEELTADDVKVTWDRVLVPDSTLVTKAMFNNIEAVKVVDEYTVAFKLIEPNGFFLSLLSQYPITPGDLYKEKGPGMFDSPVGSGPFKFVSWEPGKKMVLERNYDYWGECTSNVDVFEYHVINEDTTRLSAVRTGDIDMSDTIPGDQLDILKKDGLEIKSILSADQLYIGFQFLNSPFADYNARMAFNHALDREGLVTILGSGRPATWPCGEGSVGYDANSKMIEYNVELAKEYLAKSGYKGEEIRVIGPIGSYEKINETLAAIHNMLTAAGFKVKLEQLEGAAFGEARKAGKYDAYIVGCSFPGGDGYQFLNQRVVGDSLTSNYKSEELNTAIITSNKEVDPAKRAELLKSAYTLLMKDSAPMNFIYQYQFNYAYRPGISGVEFRIDKIPMFKNVVKSN